jgi:hypothetical protein
MSELFPNKLAVVSNPPEDGIETSCLKKETRAQKYKPSGKLWVLISEGSGESMSGSGQNYTVAGYMDEDYVRSGATDSSGYVAADYVAAGYIEGSEVESGDAYMADGYTESGYSEGSVASVSGENGNVWERWYYNHDAGCMKSITPQALFESPASVSSAAVVAAVLKNNSLKKLDRALKPSLLEDAVLSLEAIAHE